MINPLELATKVTEIDMIIKNICVKYNGYKIENDETSFTFYLPSKRLYKKKEMYEVSTAIRVKIDNYKIITTLSLPLAKTIINKYIERI